MASTQRERGTLVTIEGPETGKVLELKRALQESFGAVWDRSRKSWNVPKKERDAVLLHLAGASVEYSSRPDAEAAGGTGGVEFQFRRKPAGAPASPSRASSPAAKRPSPNPAPRKKKRIAIDEEEVADGGADEEKNAKPQKRPAPQKKAEVRKAESKKRGAKKEKAPTVAGLVFKIRKKTLVDAYRHVLKRAFPDLFGYGASWHKDWYPYEFPKKSIRDVRRQVVAWLEAHPADLAELQRHAAEATMGSGTKRTAPKKKKSDEAEGGVGGGGGGEQKDELAELKLHVSKETKPDLIYWLLERDDKDRTPHTKKYYSDQTVQVLRDLAVRRAAHIASARNHFRTSYFERTAKRQARDAEKREEKGATARVTLRLLETTRLAMRPGDRFALEFVGHWRVYGQGSGSGHLVTRRQWARVELVNHHIDPTHERDLMLAKKTHAAEIPDSRLAAKLLDRVALSDGDLLRPRAHFLAKGETIEFRVDFDRWEYRSSAAGIEGLNASITAQDIETMPSVIRRSVRDAIEHAALGMLNYHSQLANFAAEFVAAEFVAADREVPIHNEDRAAEE